MSKTGEENKEGLWGRMKFGAERRWSELKKNPGSNPKIRSKGRRPKGAGASRGKRAPQKRPRPRPKSLTQKEAKAAIHVFLQNFENYIKKDGDRDRALRSKTLYREGMPVYIPNTVSFGQIVSKPIMGRGGDIEFDVSSGNSVERHRKADLLPEIVRDIDVVSGRLNEFIVKADRHGTEIKSNTLSDAKFATGKIIDLRDEMRKPGEGRSKVIIEIGPARSALSKIVRRYKSEESASKSRSGGISDPSVREGALYRINELNSRVRLPSDALMKEWAMDFSRAVETITNLQRSKVGRYSSEGHGDYDGGPRTPVTHLKGGGRTSNPAKGSKRKLKKYKLKRDDSGRVVMPGADLRNADLREHDLERANFEGADLEGADFFRADIFKAKFGGANLRGADFLEAYLWGTDLSEALNLEESKNLHSANFLDKVILPPGFKMPNPAKGSKRKKASSKKAEPTAKELISKCRDLFEAYKKKPGRARLNAAIKQCEKMKGSKFKTVKEERARCMRGIRREKKRLGIA